MQLNIKKIATLTGHSGSVYALDVGVSEYTFFSGSSDKFVVLWNLKTLQPEKFAASFPSPVYSVCHIPEKKLLLVGTSAGSIHVLDLATKEEIKILQHHTAAVFDIKYSLQTNCFYTAGSDGNFAVCSLDKLALIKIKKLCDAKVRSIDINYYTSEIAVASGDCNIHVFDLITLENKNIFSAHQFSANKVRYSPDGKFLLTGGKDAHLNKWKMEDVEQSEIPQGGRKWELETSIPAHNFAIYDIVFSPDSSLLATASRDKTIKIWDAKTLELLVRINKENFEGHLNSVNKLLWSTYNNYLISTGDDRAIMVWEVTKV
jgi:WD40 repeat protein